MAKRKLKQTKKSIKSRLYYQNKKLKKIEKQYSQVADRSEIKKIMFNGKLIKHKTVANTLLNEAKKINNLKSTIEAKLKKYTPRTKFKKLDLDFVKSKKVKGDVLKQIGNVWNRKDFDKIISLKRNRFINGFSKARDYDKIQAQADEMFLKMDSKDIVGILEKADGNCEFFLIKDYKNKK